MYIKDSSSNVLYPSYPLPCMMSSCIQDEASYLFLLCRFAFRMNIMPLSCLYARSPGFCLSPNMSRMSILCDSNCRYGGEGHRSRRERRDL